MYALTPEIDDDWWEVEALYDLCFAPGREALSSYRLRDDVPPVPRLSLVARDPGGVLAGAIRFWPIRVGGTPALLLGPVAVHPTRQSEGLGGQLMHASLEIAQSDGWARVMLVGDAPYYNRFGFTLLQVWVSAAKWRCNAATNQSSPCARACFAAGCVGRYLR